MIIGLIRRLSVSVLRKSLLTIYKSFIRPHLNYGDILYYKPENQIFLEKVQYKACLAITGAIQGSSRQKKYDELGLHTLIERSWRSKLIFFIRCFITRISLFVSEITFERELSLKNSMNC